MAGTSIGPLTLKLIADASGMTKQLRDAAVGLDNWALKAAGNVKGVKKLFAQSANATAARGIGDGLAAGVAKIGPALQKAVGDPGRFLADNVVGGLSNAVARIPAVGALLAIPLDALGGALGAAMDQFDKGAEAIKQLGIASARTGIPMNDLRGLMVAAGPASEAMDKAIFKLQQHVMDAARGGEEAKRAFGALGISTEGIAGVKTVDLMKQLADKFATLPSGAARASAAFSLFGKQGLALLPMLAEGSAKIDRSRKLVDSLGLGVSDADLARIKRVGEAKKNMALIGEGVTNQIALGVAPILIEINNLMGSIGLSAKGMSAHVITAFEWVAKGAAYVYDAWYGLNLVGTTLWLGFKMGCEFAAVAILEFGASALDTMGKVAAKIAQVVLILAKFSPAGSIALGGLRAAGIDIQGVMKDVTGGGLAAKMREAAERGKGMIGKDRKTLLDAWAATSGMDKVKAFFDRVRATAAAAGTVIKDDQAAAMLQWFPKADEVRKQLEGPLGVFREEFEKLTKMWQSGVMAGFGGAKFGQQAMGAAFQQLNSGMNMPEKKFTGAALKDSTDAYSSIVQHQFGDQNKTVQERMVDILNEQKARQLDQIQIGKDLLDWLKANPVAIPRGLQ